MAKIVVVGFPHCGTTILRKVIGNSPDVYDYPYETVEVPEGLGVEEDHVVIKSTYSGNDPCLSRYLDTDYRVVLLIKNPFDVFGSLNRRFGEVLSVNHNLGDWYSYSKVFLEFRDNPVENFHTVQYEHLFDPGYVRVGQIYSFLGVDFSPDLVSVSRDTYISERVSYVPEVMPDDRLEGVGHGVYRTWQINQAFRNQTGKSLRYLSKDQARFLRGLDTLPPLGYSRIERGHFNA